jgi:hypothetical protein
MYVIIIANVNGTLFLIDNTMSGDRNVIMKEAEKTVKFKDPVIAIQRMWYVKTKVVVVEIRANCTSSKSFRKYLKYIPGKHDIKEVKKAILGCVHIFREVLMQKYKSVIMGR